jgi:hypothetical protein
MKMPTFEHEWFCDGPDEENRHARESTVTLVVFPKDPEAPTCRLCGDQMKKAYIENNRIRRAYSFYVGKAPIDVSHKTGWRSPGAE